MLSSDVKSLFTSFLLTETGDIVLDRVYDPKEISIVLTKDEMRTLLTLRTKNFTLNNDTDIQNDKVAMVFLLGLRNNKYCFGLLL